MLIPLQLTPHCFTCLAWYDDRIPANAIIQPGVKRTQKTHGERAVCEQCAEMVEPEDHHGNPVVVIRGLPRWMRLIQDALVHTSYFFCLKDEGRVTIHDLAPYRQTTDQLPQVA